MMPNHSGWCAWNDGVCAWIQAHQYRHLHHKTSRGGRKTDRYSRSGATKSIKKFMKKLKTIYFNLFFAALISATITPREKATIYLIGDSTVRNGDGSGRNGQWGWGTLLHRYIDTNKIAIRNHAIGGRSSRTFITEGRWTKVLEVIRPGDYLLIQFGHNDGGPLDDTARARGTIRGI